MWRGECIVYLSLAAIMQPYLILHSDIYLLPEIAKFLKIGDGYVIAANLSPVQKRMRCKHPEVLNTVLVATDKLAAELQLSGKNFVDRPTLSFYVTSPHCDILHHSVVSPLLGKEEVGDGMIRTRTIICFNSLSGL